MSSTLSWLKVSACSVALLLIAALSGCSAVVEFMGPKKQEPNQYPGAYRTELLDYLKNNPTGITVVREAYISAPSMKPFGSESRYFVCVKASGDGEQAEKIAFLSAGKIIQFVDAGEQCASAFYQSRACRIVGSGNQEEMIYKFLLAASLRHSRSISEG